jgi:hypothetical protein
LGRRHGMSCDARTTTPIARSRSTAGRPLQELGFCSHLTAKELVTAGKALTGTEFAQAVLRAEKMNPDYEPTWTRRIREEFSARFGRSFTLMD